MSIYGDNSGNSIIANAICGRCKMRFPYVELSSDPNAPGLRVCETCKDEKNPYALPSPPPDKIALQYPRPDRILKND